MTTAIVTVLMFLVMVSLHEFGHYITARMLNFKILEYAIGFGPAIWKSKRSEIQYSVRIIPFGGYCRFEGEDEASEDKRAFSNQPVWKRIIVVAAGGVFNILLGFALFAVILSAMNEPVATNTVKSVIGGTYIEEAGILPGDKIISINGKSVNSYNDITLYTSNFTAGEECELTVKRNGEKVKVSFKPSELSEEYTYTEDGVELKSSINGSDSETEFYEYSKDLLKDEELVGKTRSVNRLIIGFSPATENINLGNIWKHSLNRTTFMVKLVYSSLWDMVTGKTGVEQMSGPVGVVSEINTAVNSGEESWLYVLNLTALLTINLGVFNLLPIPALDGGRLFFMLIELISRKRIPPEKEGMVHAIGFLLLIALIIFVSYNDIVRLIAG